jgi:hypothetical protein
MSDANKVDTETQTEKPFGLAVRHRLLDLNMSIMDLAERLNVAPNTISLALNKDMFKPTQARIKEALGL